MTFGICGGEAGAQWTGCRSHGVQSGATRIGDAAGRTGRGRSGRGARAPGRYRPTMQRVRVNGAAGPLSTREAPVDERSLSRALVRSAEAQQPAPSRHDRATRHHPPARAHKLRHVSRTPRSRPQRPPSNGTHTRRRSRTARHASSPISIPQRMTRHRPRRSRTTISDVPHRA